MFTLNDLPRVVTKSKKRVGRGNGSKLGKNCGYGNKGQLARGSKMKVYFSGTTSDAGASIISRNPKKRGFKALPNKQEVQVSLYSLMSVYKTGEVVSIPTLLEKEIITKKINKVRIYLSNVIEKKLDFKFDNNDNIHLTKGVRELIK